MDEPRNVVLTDYGTAGWGLTSGSNPELVGGAGTREQLLDTYANSTVYVQQYLRVGESLVAVRCRYDAKFDTRNEITAEAVSSIDENVALMRPDSFGDRLLIVALPEDVVGDITDTLDGGQPATVVFRSDGSLYALTEVQRSDAHDQETVQEFASHHLSDDRVERLVTT